MSQIKKNTIPVLWQKKEECCGCTACLAICPKGAICMVEDEEGFEYPQIDESKCVACFQCTKVCPLKTMKEKHEEYSLFTREKTFETCLLER